MKYPINVVPLHDCVPLVVDSSQKNTVLYLKCLKPEMWQKVAKFKGAENFRKALCIYINLKLETVHFLKNICVLAAAVFFNGCGGSLTFG